MTTPADDMYHHPRTSQARHHRWNCAPTCPQHHRAGDLAGVGPAPAHDVRAFTNVFHFFASHRSLTSRRSWDDKVAPTESTAKTEDEAALREKVLMLEGIAEGHIVAPVESVAPRRGSR